jgi:hypothetical protein
VIEKANNNTTSDSPNGKTTYFNWHDCLLGFYGGLLGALSYVVTMKVLSYLTGS